MKLFVRAISPALVFVVLGLVLAGATSTPAAAHAPGIKLTGWGSAKIDGVMSPGEWSGAGQITFQANLPPAEGGGTTPVSIFVMNDKTNLYLAAKMARTSLGAPTAVRFEFDNDHDSYSEPETGDDYVSLLANMSGELIFEDGYRYPCFGASPNSGGCRTRDTDPDMGIHPPGTSDGAGNATNDGQFTYLEMSHPLNSTDDLHDFSVNFGQTVGFRVWMQLSMVAPFCNPHERLRDCLIDTSFPQTPGGDWLYGDMVIASPYQFTGFYPPVDNPPAVNVGVAGQTIPLKWSIKDRSNGQYVSDLGVVKSYGFQVSSCAPGTAGTVDTSASARASNLRYSPDENQFVLNWRTDHTWAGKCGTMTLTLVDGTQYKANFQFK